MFYLHPWEIDPDQPRLNGRALSRFRHYRNLELTEGRLRRLLKEFRFGTVSDVLGQCGASRLAERRRVNSVVLQDVQAEVVKG